MAPLANWAPNTRGVAKPRLLPEHWFTATTSIAGALALMSANDSESGVRTAPPTCRR